MLVTGALIRYWHAVYASSAVSSLLCFNRQKHTQYTFLMSDLINTVLN